MPMQSDNNPAPKMIPLPRKQFLSDKLIKKHKTVTCHARNLRSEQYIVRSRDCFQSRIV